MNSNSDKVGMGNNKTACGDGKSKINYGSLQLYSEFKKIAHNFLMKAPYSNAEKLTSKVDYHPNPKNLDIAQIFK